MPHADPTSRAAYLAQWREKNRERLREKYEQNRDQILQQKRQYYRDNHAQIRAYQNGRKEHRRDWHLQRTYSISSAEWETLFNAQGRRCAICEIEDSPKWCTDHDHDTGKVREILCNHCNAGLGHFRDTPGLIDKAAGYLRKHGKC